MQGNRKPFDSALHARTDSPGKDATLKLVDRLLSHKSNLRTIENPDKHGIDLLTLNERDEVVACWEVEVRLESWEGDRSFPFDSMNCLERKDHMWMKKNTFTSNIPFPVTSNCEVFYVQLNNLHNRFAIVEGEQVLKCRLRPQPNKRQHGEYVRQVPTEWLVQKRL